MSVEGGGVPPPGASASDMTAVKAVTDALVVAVTEAAGTFSFDETSAAEQDALELVIAARVEIGSIHFDFVNVTQDVTVKTYHKVDGSNYREVQSNAWTFGVDSDGVIVEGFTAYRDVKVTFTCTGAGAGSVDVPYAAV